ncbi:signal peptidase I [Novisyntrophococcus fermenticellae]|uniref:signal peptidase I n=1 Tax=Novisyntrophococcus fermenticellae TaxID=2068655 RepID=UPI001E3DEFE7|nr:signal peptidase I [Novisyntrophococcus fermenticellae]
MGFSPRYVKDYFLQSKVKAILIYVVEIALIVLLAAGVSFFFCKSIVLQEGSMEPTLKAGDRVLINSASYKLSSPKRGDIIVYRTTEDAKSSLHVKRIIGLPGETVQIKDGQILIDNKTYVEKKGFPAITNPGLAEDTVKLGSGEYFVLGDNRNNSEDSRHVDMGNIKKKNIIGKLWFVVAPMDRFGILKK